MEKAHVLTLERPSNPGRPRAIFTIVSCRRSSAVAWLPVSRSRYRRRGFDSSCATPSNDRDSAKGWVTVSSPVPAPRESPAGPQSTAVACSPSSCLHSHTGFVHLSIPPDDQHRCHTTKFMYPSPARIRLRHRKRRHTKALATKGEERCVKKSRIAVKRNRKGRRSSRCLTAAAR
jgi:hypothetical protein